MPDNNAKSPIPFIRPQYFDANGAPLALGKLYTYAAGGTSNLATYTTPKGDIANDNPVVLDSAGRPSKSAAGVGVNLSNAAYHIVLKDAAGNTIFDEDNVWSDSPYSGRYAPVMTGVTNVDTITTAPAIYQRIGDIVTVHGSFSLNCTAGAPTATEFSISLPIASNLALGSDLNGGCICFATNQFPGVITANTVGEVAKVQLQSANTTDFAWTYHFSYQILS